MLSADPPDASLPSIESELDGLERIELDSFELELPLLDSVDEMSVDGDADDGEEVTPAVVEDDSAEADDPTTGSPDGAPEEQPATKQIAAPETNTAVKREGRAFAAAVPRLMRGASSSQLIRMSPHLGHLSCTLNDSGGSRGLARTVHTTPSDSAGSSA